MAGDRPVPELRRRLAPPPLRHPPDRCRHCRRRRGSLRHRSAAGARRRGGGRHGRRRRDLHRAADHPRGRRTGRGGQDRRLRARRRRAVRPRHPDVRRDATSCRAVAGSVPVVARRARHARARLRLDVPGRRRHRQHRRRRAQHDEGLQAAQPQHAPRSVRIDRSRALVAGPVPREAAGVAAPDERRTAPRAGLGRHRRCRRVRQPDERRRHRLRLGERHVGRRQVPRRPGHRAGNVRHAWSASASTGSCGPGAGSASSSATHGCSEPVCASPSARRRPPTSRWR